jgi:hypothetical protein
MTIYDCPAMSWNDFINIPNGETVYNHGASQCVALANLYNEGVLGGGFVQVGRAIDWWTNPNVASVHGFTQVLDNPQAGDIFIGSYGYYDPYNGHIGVVVRSWDGSTFGTMEQNVGGEWVSRHDRTMANIDGFLRPINSPIPSEPVAPSLAGNQRVAGPEGANRRAEPNTQGEILEPHLEAGTVGNFVNWAHGEDPYGNGNDVWFQGISGNWFYSGAFTDQGTHDLTDVTVYPAVPTPTPEPTPVAPEPTPVTPPKEEVVITVKTEKEKEVTVTKPSVKPENIEHKEDAMSTPTASPAAGVSLEEWKATQKELASQLKPVDLGSIITNNKARKIVWAIYGLTGLVIIALMGGLTAAQIIAPVWFIFATGAYTAIGPAFASLAMANITTKKD